MMHHPELRGLRIVSDNYQIPSLVNLYLHPHPEAIGLTLSAYHATLYSMLYPAHTLAGGHFLFLRLGDSLSPDLLGYFTTATLQHTFISRRQGKDYAHLTLWDVRGFRGE